MAEPREELAKALTGYLTPEQLVKLTDEILASSKQAWAEFSCKKCGQRQRQQVTVPDAKAVAQVLPALLDQAYGRPGQVEPVQEGITFVYEYVSPELMGNGWGDTDAGTP